MSHITINQILDTRPDYVLYADYNSITERFEPNCSFIEEQTWCTKANDLLTPWAITERSECLAGVDCSYDYDQETGLPM